MSPPLARLLRTLTIGFLVVPAAGSFLSAQSPDSIPRDLVLGLVGAGNLPGRDPLRVGTIPNYVPSDLIPPGALILGSLSLPGRTTIVLHFPPGSSDPGVLVREHLSSLGWTAPERFTPNYRPRGFVTSISSSVSSPALCRNGAQILLTSGRREAGTGTATVNWMPAGNMGLCNAPLRAAGRFEDSPVPPLLPPEGMGQETAGTSGSSNGLIFSARLLGTMTPDSVRQHYAEQLLTAGWTAGPAMGTAAASLQTFTHEGVDGSPGPWHALFTAAALGREGALDLLLQVRRP